MTGLENITQKILDEANEKAKILIDSANTQAIQIKKSADVDIKVKQEQMKKRTEENAMAQAHRIVAAAQLDGKKEYLAAKQEIIDSVFEKAIAYLTSLNDSEYDELIKSMSFGVSGDITLLPRDKEKGTGGGFVAKNGNIEYNFSFEALAKNAKEHLEKELVSILFG